MASTTSIAALAAKTKAHFEGMNKGKSTDAKYHAEYYGPASKLEWLWLVTPMQAVGPEAVAAVHKNWYTLFPDLTICFGDIMCDEKNSMAMLCANITATSAATGEALKIEAWLKVTAGEDGKLGAAKWNTDFTHIMTVGGAHDPVGAAAKMAPADWKTMEKDVTTFFDACESGKGWAACKNYCTPDATFECQGVGPVTGIKRLEQYTNWMLGVCKAVPNSAYDVSSVAFGKDCQSALFFATFSGTHSATVEGFPPPTGKSTKSHYVYCIFLDPATQKITGMTKVWNDAYAMAEFGWGPPPAADDAA